MIILEVDKISKSFGKTTPLFHNLILKVHAGEVLCLFGPSGSGKTTLLRIIAGLTQPTAGKILFPSNQKKSKRITLGYVFQEPRLIPWKTVADNILFASRSSNKFSSTPPQQLIKNVLSLVQLNGFENRYPHQLSEGEKQRISIARSLSINPNLLLMDEPFSHLDDITATKLRVDILRILESIKTTTIFATHNPLEAIFLADRIICFTNDKPTRIKRELRINISKPRNKNLYTEFIFQNKTRSILKSLLHFRNSTGTDYEH